MDFFNCKKTKKIKNEIKIQNLKELNYYLDVKIDMILYKIDNIDEYKTILSLEEDYVQLSDKDFKKMDDRNLKICKYKHINNKCCKDCLKRTESMLLDMCKNVTNKLNRYNQYINTIKDVNYLIYNSHGLENIIIKFGFDNENELICLFYDCKKALDINLKNNEEIGNIYVVFGDLHKTKNEHKSCLRINLRFDNYSKQWLTIHINQIHAATGRMKCGHGTFALMNMEYIISSINSKLKNLINIKEIKGDIKETKEYISRKNLVKFYKKMGFDIYKDSSFKKFLLSY